MLRKRFRLGFRTLLAAKWRKFVPWGMLAYALLGLLVWYGISSYDFAIEGELAAVIVAAAILLRILIMFLSAYFQAQPARIFDVVFSEITILLSRPNAEAEQYVGWVWVQRVRENKRAFILHVAGEDMGMSKSKRFRLELPKREMSLDEQRVFRLWLQMNEKV